MTDEPPNDDFFQEPEETPQPDEPTEDPIDPGPQTQKIQQAPQVSALVPESVAKGVFSTGAVVLQGQHEFILDFLVRMQQPQQVAARVILPPPVVPQFLQALKENIRKYEDRFGTIVDPAKAIQKKQKNQQRQSAQDLYDALKLADEVRSGAYANAVMIGHSAYEFSFDFITTFFPRSAVSCRVFLSAPNAPRLLDSLTHSFTQFQKQRGMQPPPQNPPDGEGGPDGENPFGTGTFGDG